jgi:hypothetical protein
MTKRAMFVAACFVLSGICLLLWQRSTSGQVGPQQPAAAPAPSNPRNMPLGGEVSVYLRGDATGTSSGNRVIDLSSLINLKGTLEAGGDHWIVLKTDDGKREWFPVEAVAAVVAEK